MTERFLTITLQPDWKGALRAMAQAAKADEYQGEVLNFESPAHFFGQLSEKRWEIVRATQGKGELSVRELARVVGRTVARPLPSWRWASRCRPPRLRPRLGRRPPPSCRPWGSPLTTLSFS